MITFRTTKSKVDFVSDGSVVNVVIDDKLIASLDLIMLYDFITSRVRDLGSELDQVDVDEYPYKQGLIRRRAEMRLLSNIQAYARVFGGI
jgi:hypothetical protein